jgi:hypothetical protein
LSKAGEALDGLVRFLLARISEDEAAIRSRIRAGEARSRTGGWLPEDRAMAECAAKRDIIGLMQRMLVLRDLPHERSVRAGAAAVLRRMAVLYDEHPAYRDGWRPAPGMVLS